MMRPTAACLKKKTMIYIPIRQIGQQIRLIQKNFHYKLCSVARSATSRYAVRVDTSY